MRLGRKNGCVRQWAKRGSRPRQPADQRYESAYVFGAVCPERDTGAALVLPYADTFAMQQHLNEIAKQVAPVSHAVVLLDNAGWHKAKKLKWPGNLSPLFIPPGCPELNATENIWQYLRQTYLSNRVFTAYDGIVDAACDAWNKLLAETGRISSIATRTWAVTGQ
jgi:transposase